MPRGTPLTPEQLGRAAEVYARTGSYSEAARAEGIDVSAVRRALLRLGEPNATKPHARAVSEGLDRGRRTLDGIVREVRRRTRTRAQRETLDFEALLLAAKTASYGVQRLADLAELALRQRQAKLTRAKTRAEIDALKKGTTLTTEQLLAYLAALPREELLGLVATLRARREAPATPTTTPAAPTTTPPPRTP